MFDTWNPASTTAGLVPLEPLVGDDPAHGDAVVNTVIVKLSHNNNIRLAILGVPLRGDHLVAVQGDGGLALPAISGFFIKLLSESEADVDRLHGGLGDHVPLAPGLADGHDRGGGHGSLPQHEPNVQSLQDIFVSFPM